MCGIAGIINGSPKSEEILQSMLNSIKHRGPDDWGMHVDKERGAFLGSRRLSILDLSPKGHMPMYSADRSLVICQNGEIYNYPQLKVELEKLGYHFESSSDTEAILHGYEEWGTGVFEKLQGMFAISIYDSRNHKFILVRDRIGIKPVYYLSKDRTLYYSSEVKAFDNIPDFSLRGNLDMEAVNKMLGFMFYPDSAHTMIRGVLKLEPGYFLEVNSETGEYTKNRYWSLIENEQVKRLSFEDAVSQLENLLKETVKSHLMSDVPLGVLLSGGLDSSLITALMKEQTNGEVLTFNAKFNHKFNESEYAKQVSEHLGTKHQEILIDAGVINNNIEAYIKDFDDLTSFDGGLISTKILCTELKRQGVTVVLLGEGSDEIFGGYSWFGLSQLPYSVMPNRVVSALYYYALSRNITFNPKFYYDIWHQKYIENYNEDMFRNISSVELNVQLSNHLLMKVDKGTMAASVEARVPYLDHKVVEFVYSLPSQFKLKGSVQSMRNINEKYILREVAKKYLPEEIVARKKRGFLMPMDDVLKANLDKVRDYAFSANSVSQKLMTVSALEDLFEPTDFKVLQQQKEYLLWRIFLIESWNRAYGSK
ncbi:asparagine synthase (glutamine-hydrolyzing) [candidate division WWE3 bacterium RIFOXYC1_FULL_39_7]|uniref:asparagine synthase (glutamine-hydrolyzing) n=1 Tax=candidate division WWE3 bacterium RIFOXYC1_FULL_39_7 TaxID=1802643 RepID=A0A1F4WL47_UNCKA|nr:MAG: asparagine synthase (glutamine-hydrolyzing) [candidate division WWE3 bacterium RIFOXYC1_FULL_39_7]